MTIVPHVPQNDITAPTQGRTVAELLTASERDYLPLKAPATQYRQRLLYRWLRAELGTIPLAALTPLVLRRWRDSFGTTRTSPRAPSWRTLPPWPRAKRVFPGVAWSWRSSATGLPSN